MKKKFKLRPRARIVKTFGEELISNDYVAIIELIKNSYDADARNVKVTFSDSLEKGEGSIVILDDGNGMSSEEVQSGWMEPASISKFNKRKSKEGRAFLGQKGIGRFSTAKLAEGLDLITRKKDSDEEIIVNFNWADYYSPDKYLDQVEGTWEVTDPSHIESHGTILNMNKLQASWGEERVNDLLSYLRRLVSPVSPPSNFKIEVIFPEEFSHLSGEVTPTETVNQPDYAVKGTLDKNAHLLVEYVSKKIGAKTEILKDQKMILESGNSPNFGPISFELRVWDRDRLGDLAKDIGKSISVARKDLDAIAGVSIYRDEFRVSPYGNRENDWLRLDLRRVQNPTLRLSNNQIVGSVFITGKDNPDFTDQTNREGIVESDSFRDLQEVIRSILSLVEAKRYSERRETPVEEESGHGRLFANIDLGTVREVIEAKLPGDKEAIKVVKKKEAELKKRDETLKDFISRYRRLSTLGQLTDIILHDAGAGLTRISSGLEILDKETDKETPSIDKIKRNIKISKDGSFMLSELFKRLEPFGGRKRERAKKMIAEKSIEEVFAIFSSEIESLGIEILVPQTKTEIVASESDFKLVFTNLINNSLYWLKKSDTKNKKIQVKLLLDEEKFEILFADNGPGVVEENRSLIFDPYFSTKPEGVGLGLTIVGEFASERGGHLDLVEEALLAGANFRITLPLKK